MCARRGWGRSIGNHNGVTESNLSLKPTQLCVPLRDTRTGFTMIKDRPRNSGGGAGARGQKGEATFTKRTQWGGCCSFVCGVSCFGLCAPGIGKQKSSVYGGDKFEDVWVCA